MSLLVYEICLKQEVDGFFPITNELRFFKTKERFS
jgi:hypothetical protein